MHFDLSLFSHGVSFLSCIRGRCVVTAATLLLLGATSSRAQQSDGASLYPPISFDGSVVAFHSLGTNLVPGDTNGVGDVFVFDRAAGTFECASVATSGTQSNGPSTYAGLSGDGRYVVFTSSGSNLVASDTNGVDDVFVRDRFAATTTRISVDSGGQQSNGPSYSYNLPITADGRFVAFQSLADNLVGGDTNGTWDVFVHDRQTGATTRASVGPLGAEANGPSLHSSISAFDGRYIAFHSIASNLAPNDLNTTWDVFVRDLQASSTILVSVAQSGSSGDDYSDRGSIDGSGRYVAFSSGATNLIVGDTNGIEDVFVRDLQGALTVRVSVSSSGGQMSGGILADRKSSISADARFVLFRSDAANLVPGDTNAAQDIFVHDRDPDENGVFDELGNVMTERVSVGSGGIEANSQSDHHAISLGGSFVTFSSTATNLVPNDSNGVDDIFLRNRVSGVTTRMSVPGGSAFTTFCTSGTSSNGCAAWISGTGTPSALLPSGFWIEVAGVDALKAGLLFYGVSGATAVPWGVGSSFLCIKAPTQRTGLQNSGGTAGACDGFCLLDWNAYRTSHPSALGSPFSAGDSLWAQAWYRDPPSSKSTSLSNGLAYTLQP